MFSMSRSTKNFPQLKMCDNCEELFLLKCIFCWLTAFGYSNNQTEATLLQNVKSEKLNFENHWHIWFFSAILITYIKGEPLPTFFCRRGLQWWRLHLLIFFSEVIKFYWLMLLLYPGELYRLLGASSYLWLTKPHCHIPSDVWLGFYIVLKHFLVHVIEGSVNNS